MKLVERSDIAIDLLHGAKSLGIDPLAFCCMANRLITLDQEQFNIPTWPIPPDTQVREISSKGVLRDSTWDEAHRPIIANGETFIFNTPENKEVEGLVTKLFEKIDFVFGKQLQNTYIQFDQNKNLAVTTLDIFKMLSLTQMMFATIHPFREGNGRTSELLIQYIIEYYMPTNLKCEIQRYISSNGRRDNLTLIKRSNLFDNWFTYLNQTIASDMGCNHYNLMTYVDIANSYERMWKMNKKPFSSEYQKHLLSVIYSYIDYINPTVIDQLPHELQRHVNGMADNLSKASSRYDQTHGKDPLLEDILAHVL